MSAVEAGTIEWTRQRPDLWTGRRSGTPVGTIEHGARFTYIDVQGAAHRGYRTLDAAQSAAAVPLPPHDSGPAGPHWSVHPVLLIAVPAVLVIDAVLLGGAMLLT